MNNKSYYRFGVGVFILLIAIFLYIGSFNKMHEYTQWVNHTHEVMIAYEKIASDIKSAQVYSSVIGIKRNDSIYELYKDDGKDIPVDFARLSYLVSDNPKQKERVKLLDQNYKSFTDLGSANRADSLRDTHAKGQFKNLLLMQRLIEEGINDERILLTKRKNDFRTYLFSTNVLSGVFITTSLALIIGTAASSAKAVKKRYQVEQFLESVINTSQHGIITYEAIRNEFNEIIDFRAVFANDAIARQTGSSPAEMVGKTLTEISGNNGARERMKHYIRVVETGQKDSLEITEQIRKKKIWIHVIIAKLNDGFTATSYDITDIKNVQSELEEKVVQLETTNSELEQFAYVASHDLQEPLRKIKTFASLINERFNEPSAAFAKIYLNKVIESADRMSHLINDLLNLTDLSRQQEAFVNTDLNNVIKYVMVDFDLIVEEKKAVLHCVDLPVIEAIVPQMNQLFYNLINNAFKFSKADIPPVISINCKLLSGPECTGYGLDIEKQYFEISVCDNGIGFNPDYADKIFNIFQRLNNRKQYSGSGIGLALCRKIVLNHHGVIQATSKEGQGACFNLILPAVQNF